MREAGFCCKRRWVRVPVPGPISKTFFPIKGPKEEEMIRKKTGSCKKCCPSFFRGVGVRGYTVLWCGGCLIEGSSLFNSSNKA